MTPKVGEIWRHFRGGEYRIIGFARSTELGMKLLVIYQTLGTVETWARPISEFTEWMKDAPLDKAATVTGPQATYTGPRFVIREDGRKDPRD